MSDMLHPKPPLRKGRWHGVSRDGGIDGHPDPYQGQGNKSTPQSALRLTAPLAQGSQKDSTIPLCLSFWERWHSVSRDGEGVWPGSDSIPLGAAFSNRIVLRERRVLSTPSTLWTRDFTIITLGSVVSMVGSNMSGFAMSIMVLDYTGSTLLYAIFNICFQLPVLIVPLLAGPYLDRMSRKKVIYRLDFLSASLYLLMFLLMWQGWFNYLLLLAFCLITGAINSAYSVAYDSFYPNLITEGNFSKAYSISSLLWPLAAMTAPIAALIYDQMGSILPLLAIDAVSFFVAACFERTIRYQETHMSEAAPVVSQNPLRQFGVDFKEGLSYILSEKGLLAVTLYFTVSNFAGSGGGTLHLPFFRSHAYLYAMWPVAAVTLYAIVSNGAVIGRLVGGLVHYKVHFPTQLKFRIAVMVYFVVAILAAVELYLPIPLLALSFFITGLLGVTSYNIRISATQSYVPDTKRARFNGTFQMLCSLGGVVGTLLAGVLAEGMDERHVILLLETVDVAAILLFMVGGRKFVAKLYNRDL